MSRPKDDNTTIQTLKDIVNDFSLKRDWTKFHNPKDLSIGIVTEASELLALFRFKTEAETSKLLTDKASTVQVRYELADVLFFILRLSQVTGIDLAQALLAKMKLNEKRYPISKSKGSNKKYTEL